MHRYPIKRRLGHSFPNHIRTPVSANPHFMNFVRRYVNTSTKTKCFLVIAILRISDRELSRQDKMCSETWMGVRVVVIVSVRLEHISSPSETSRRHSRTVSPRVDRRESPGANLSFGLLRRDIRHASQPVSNSGWCASKVLSERYSSGAITNNAQRIDLRTSKL